MKRIRLIAFILVLPCPLRGETLSLVAGLTAATVCDEGESAAAEQKPDADRFVPGVKLFSDREYQLTEEAPDFLRGMQFIRCNISGTPRLVCTEPGTLYALTPAVREGAASQTKTLETAGFKRHTMQEFQLFPDRDIERVVLFTKVLEKGDRVRFGKWTVLLAPKMVLARPEVTHYETLYNLDAVAYESLMLGAFTVHLGPDNDTCFKARAPKITEFHLGFSRDGFHWSRSDDRSPFIPASRTAGTWDRAYLHSNAALCVIVDDELWFYYTGFQGDYTGCPGETRPGGMYENASMGIARLRRDGFASMDAGPDGGGLTTRPLRFSRGDRLFVNVNNPTGSLRAEIADASGAPIKGFTFADCTPLATDSTQAMIAWKGDGDLTALHNRPVRVRFNLTSGSLYAFWIADKTGASHGYLAGGSPGHSGLVDDDISADE